MAEPRSSYGSLISRIAASQQQTRLVSPADPPAPAGGFHNHDRKRHNATYQQSSTRSPRQEEPEHSSSSRWRSLSDEDDEAPAAAAAKGHSMLSHNSTDARSIYDLLPVVRAQVSNSTIINIDHDDNCSASVTAAPDFDDDTTVNSSISGLHNMQVVMEEEEEEEAEAQQSSHCQGDSDNINDVSCHSLSHYEPLPQRRRSLAPEEVDSQQQQVSAAATTTSHGSTPTTATRDVVVPALSVRSHHHYGNPNSSSNHSTSTTTPSTLFVLADELQILPPERDNTAHAYATATAVVPSRCSQPPRSCSSSSQAALTRSYHSHPHPLEQRHRIPREQQREQHRHRQSYSAARTNGCSSHATATTRSTSHYPISSNGRSSSPSSGRRRRRHYTGNCSAPMEEEDQATASHAYIGNHHSNSSGAYVAEEEDQATPSHAYIGNNSSSATSNDSSTRAAAGIGGGRTRTSTSLQVQVGGRGPVEDDDGSHRVERQRRLPLVHSSRDTPAGGGVFPGGGSSHDDRRSSSSRTTPSHRPSGTANFGPVFPYPKARALEHAQLDQLGFPLGLTEEVAKNIAAFPLRYWIVDNSRSMMEYNDGRRLHVDPHMEKASIVECTRWSELSNSVIGHIKLASALQISTVFRLLNDPRGDGPQEFGIANPGVLEKIYARYAPRNRNNSHRTNKDEAVVLEAMIRSQIEKDAQVGKKVIRSIQPRGGKPLAELILKFRRRIERHEQQLRAHQQQAVLVVATDGLPTDKYGDETEAAQREVVSIVKSLPILPMCVVIRMCTNDRRIRGFYQSLVDKNKELNVVIVDDFLNEAGKIYAHNPWLNYALPLHRCREMGHQHRVLDLLAKRPLNRDELLQFLFLLFGKSSMMDAPDIHTNFAGFLKFLDIVNNKARAKHWRVQSMKKEHWIDMKKFRRSFGHSLIKF